MGFMVQPSRWERDHAGFVFRSQAYQDRHDGGLPSTPIWRMLERRFDLDQARFSFWHPNVARMILRSREDAYVPVLPPGPVIPPCIPAVPVVPPGLDPCRGGEQVVPAPGSLALGLAAVAAFVSRRLCGF